MNDDTRLRRRDVVIGAASAVVLAAAPADAQNSGQTPAPATPPATPPSSAATAASEAITARGVVFEDDANVLQPGPRSRGLPGVLVSNGREVTRTDAQGRYAIAVSPGQSVFVIKPSGYETFTYEQTALPYFAYVYAPEGSPPGFRFSGLEPSGPLPDSINFPLRRADEPSQYDALLFTDPQPETGAELDYVRDDVVARTAGIDAAFGITTGDLMFDDLSYYGRYNAMLATTGLVWRSVPGNHDINVEAPDDTHSRDTWKRVFGARHYAFQHGGVTYVMLDNVQYLGADPSKPGALGKYRGYFGDEQLAFVRNLLGEIPRDLLVVFCFHIPLRTLVGTEPNTATVDAHDFLAAISTHPHSVSFCGHTHTNEHHYLGTEYGFTGGTHHHHVLAAVSGSWWSGPFDVRGIPVALQTEGCPNGFHVLSINGAAYTTRFVPASDPERSQIRIMLDTQVHESAPEVMKDYSPGALLRSPVRAEAVTATRLLANLFDGGPRSTLTFRVDDGDTLPMRRTERVDPWVAEVYMRHAETKKPWVSAGKSSHLWQATLPAGIAAGTHRVEVRATDEYGAEHVAMLVLEVIG